MKEKMAGESAQLFEKVRFGQENPSQGKPFSLIVLGGTWLDFAGFG
jgi:hypothetical protein